MVVIFSIMVFFALNPLMVGALNSPKSMSAC